MNEEMIQPTEGLAFFRRGRNLDEMKTVQLRRTLICADGFHLSVQAHRGAWAEPSDDKGPWRVVEVATKDQVIGWDRFLDHDVAVAGTTGWRFFYAHVPLIVVETFAVAHGGIIGERG